MSGVEGFMYPNEVGLLDYLADRAELVADRLGLAHQCVEHDVGLALLIPEIATGDDLGGCSLRSMRPLRCSMREGFHGRSKWIRSAQRVWRLMPSRAASVHSRMRTGSCSGSALNARLTCSRRWRRLRRKRPGCVPPPGRFHRLPL